MGPLLGMVVLALDIIAIVDVVRSSMDNGRKILWIILVLFMPLLGLILYFLLAKKQGK